MYFSESAIMTTPNACVVDLTGPTFAGITSAAAQINGSVNVGWGAAIDATLPLTYAVYVKTGSAPNPAVDIPATLTRSLSAKVYVDGLQALLVKGTTYYFLVRAIDGVGNQDANLISLTAVSAGVLTDDLVAIAASLAATDVTFAATEVLLAIDQVNLNADIANLNAQLIALAAYISQLESDIAEIDLIRLSEAIQAALASTKSLLEISIVGDELEAQIETDEIVAEIDEDELS